MEICYFCKKGVLENKKVTVDFRWGSKLIVIEEVPAKVCNECGEKYYSAQVSREMEKIAEEGKKERSHWEITLHNLYVYAAHNTIMDRVNEGLASIIERNTTLSNIIFMTIDDWFDVVVSQHEQLVQAIEEKNARKAKAIMIQHLEDSMQKLEKLSEDGLFSFAYKRTLPNSSLSG